MDQIHLYLNDLMVLVYLILFQKYFLIYLLNFYFHLLLYYVKNLFKVLLSHSYIHPHYIHHFILILFQVYNIILLRHLSSQAIMKGL